MGQTLAEILDAAAGGNFPPPDGGTTVVPQPNHRDAGVIAFTAHSVVFIDEDPQWVHETLAALDCDKLAATMNPRFLTTLLNRTGRSTDTIDLLTVATSLPGEPAIQLHEIANPDHPRVRSARQRRDNVHVWAVGGGVRHTRSRSGRPLGDGDRGGPAGTAPRPRPSVGTRCPPPRTSGRTGLGAAGRGQRAQYPRISGRWLPTRRR